MIVNNPFSLGNKTIIITGASSGIGRECAIACSKMGARIVLIGRSNDRLIETLSLMDKNNIHIPINLDLNQYDLFPTKITDIKDSVGKIDGIIHCAGISTTLPLKFVKHEKLVEFFSTNVFSSYNLTRDVIKNNLFNENGGSIIFISSIMGIVGENGKSLYSMTKGALISACKSLSIELAKKKIRVNCILPGAIITPINEKLPHIADPEQRKKLEDKHLLGLGETTDVANGAIFLLSNASRWVTGTNLIIDGGYTAK